MQAIVQDRSLADLLISSLVAVGVGYTNGCAEEVPTATALSSDIYDWPCFVIIFSAQFDGFWVQHWDEP